MEPETNNDTFVQEIEKKSSLHKVTPLSKYLAMALFIIMPFVGGWIGYQYAPEKIVEVEKVMFEEKATSSGAVILENNPEVKNVEKGITLQNLSVNDFSGITLLDIRDWQETGDDLLSFNVSYPPDWEYKSSKRWLGNEESFSRETHLGAVLGIDELTKEEFASVVKVYDVDKEVEKVSVETVTVKDLKYTVYTKSYLGVPHWQIFSTKLSNGKYAVVNNYSDCSMAGCDKPKFLPKETLYAILSSLIERETESITNITNIQAIDVDYSTWLTYQSDHFKFNYPPEWKKWELTSGGRVDSVALSPFWESDKIAEYPGTDYPYGLVWIWFEGGGCSSDQFDETVSLDNETEVAVKDYTTDEGEPNPTYNNKHIVEACYQYGEKLNTGSVNLRYVSELNDDTYLEEFWQILSTIGPTVVYPQEGYIESVATPGDAYVLHVRGFDWSWPDNNLLVKKNSDVSEVTVIEDVPLVVNAELKNLMLKDEVDVRRMYSDGIEAPLGEVSFFDFAGIYLHQYYHETPIDNPFVVNTFYSSPWGFEYETNEDGKKRLVRITQIYTP